LTDVETLSGPEVNPLADPVAPTATPVMMTDTYVEIGGANLKCLAEEVSLEAELKPIEVTTFCGVQEYPGPTKWHFKVKLVQAFDPGATDATLSAALASYAASGAPVAFKVRPYASRSVSATNPQFSGLAIPQPYTVFGGAAGSQSEVDIDWIMTGPPTKSTAGVAATGATAGAPGYYTPSGATTPANLAALTGLTATPATAWTTGQYVVTADLLAANWTSSAWAAGIHA
jgi:hypothetical protein